MAKSLLDQAQIMKYAFDESSEALKTTIVSTDLSMELSADDGDSILIRPDSVSTAITINQEVDVTKYASVCLYAKVNSGGPYALALEVSPEESGTFWHQVASVNVTTTAREVVDKLCAKRVRVTSGGSPDVTLVLVGMGV